MIANVQWLYIIYFLIGRPVLESQDLDALFCAKGYYVSTAGRDEETIRQYIRKQEDVDRKIDQLKLFK